MDNIVTAPAPASADLSGFDFGDAIRALKKGCRVRRAGWNGKGMFLLLCRVDGIERHYEPRSANWSDDEMDMPLLPCIVLKTVGNEFQPGWNASTPDLLATDWQVVEESSAGFSYPHPANL